MSMLERAKKFNKEFNASKKVAQKLPRADTIPANGRHTDGFWYVKL